MGYIEVQTSPKGILLLIIYIDAVAGPEGQDHWSKHYPYCGGAFQSPIDIKSELLRFDPTLRPIEVQNYNLSPNEQLTLGNNGHSGEYKSSVLSPKYIIRYRHVQLNVYFKLASSQVTKLCIKLSKCFRADKVHIMFYLSWDLGSTSQRIH